MVVNYLVLEGASWVAMRTIWRSPDLESRLTLSENDREALRLLVDDPAFLGLKVDPVLGWSHLPNMPNRPTNKLGLRGAAPVEVSAPDGVVRVACMGDSFTFCSEVSVEESWPHRAQAMLEKSEFLNFGLAGTGVTQSYLRFQHEAKPLRPRVVVIGFLRQNFFRAVNVYRPFLRPGSGPPIPQPYAAIEDDTLVIHPPLFQALGDLPGFLNDPKPILSDLMRRDYIMQRFVENTSGSPLWRLGRRVAGHEFIQDSTNTLLKRRLLTPKPDLRDIENSPLDTDPHLLEVNRRLMAQYIRDVRDAGAVPLLLVYAGKLDVLRFNQGKPLLYEPFLKAIEPEGAETIEVVEALAKQMGRPLESEAVFKGGHYSPRANEVVARTVVERVRALIPQAAVDGDPAGER